MAISGSSNFSVTAADIIEAALVKVGIVNETVPKVFRKHQDRALFELNMLCKYYRTKGLILWKQEEIRLDLETGRRAYYFDSSNNDAQLVKRVSAVTTAASSGASTINVAGTTSDYASGDTVEIELDDKTMHTTTLSATPTVSGTGFVTLDLTDALTDDVAVGNEVTAYTTETRIPTSIDRAYRRTYGSTNTAEYTDVDIDIESRDYYQRQYQKTQSSTDPQVVYYERELSRGVVWVWPVPEDTYTSLMLTCNFHVDDFDALTDNPDFHQEWYMVLVYGLASILADNWPDISPVKAAQLKRKADEFLAAATDDDEEQGSLFIMPNDRPSR